MESGEKGALTSDAGCRLSTGLRTREIDALAAYSRIPDLRRQDAIQDAAGTLIGSCNKVR
jgi:hypothetical protein